VAINITPAGRAGTGRALEQAAGKVVAAEMVGVAANAKKLFELAEFEYSPDVC